MQKKCLLITAPLSTYNVLVYLLLVSAGRSWTWVRRSYVALPIAGHSNQLLHCCATFRVSFCFQKAVKISIFTTVMLCPLVPVISPVSQMYASLPFKMTTMKPRMNVLYGGQDVVFGTACSTIAVFFLWRAHRFLFLTTEGLLPLHSDSTLSP